MEQLSIDLSEGDSDHAALLAPGRAPMSRGELAAQVSAVAAGLIERGVRAGDPIGIVGPNGPEAAVAFLAVSSVATAAPLNPALRPAELAFELDDLHLRAVVVVGPWHPIEDEAEAAGVVCLRLDAAPPGSHGARAAGAVALAGGDLPDAADLTAGPAFAPDVSLVLHTSGTTARPKIVPLTRANLAASARAVAETLRLAPDDIGLEVMPLFHVHGLVAGLLAGLHAGSAVACTPGFHAPDLPAWWAGLAPTWLTAVPTMHHALVERLRTHPSEMPARPLRLLRSSSAPLAPGLLSTVEELFRAPLVEAYGMTEAAHQITSNAPSPGERRPGSVGPAAGPEVAVMGDAGWVGPDEEGEVVIRGANVIDGYAGTAAVAGDDTFVEGWFRTGDLGRLDSDGYLTLTGRIKEVINRGGEKISPREVDEVLLEHRSVNQAVTFAMPDARLGEEVAAAVVTRGDRPPNERDLRLFVSTRLAAHKVPKRVVVVDELPKGPTGKLTRIGLAAELGLDQPNGAGSPAAGGTARVEPSTDVERFVAELWGEVLRLSPSPGVHDHFLDLGGDSMAANLLLAALRDRLALDVSMFDLFDLPTVAEQAELVERLLLAADAG